MPDYLYNIGIIGALLKTMRRTEVASSIASLWPEVWIKNIKSDTMLHIIIDIIWFNENVFFSFKIEKLY